MITKIKKAFFNYCLENNYDEIEKLYNKADQQQKNNYFLTVLALSNEYLINFYIYELDFNIEKTELDKLFLEYPKLNNRKDEIFDKFKTKWFKNKIENILDKKFEDKKKLKI